VDLSDLELSQFTSNDLFEARFGHLGDIWHVVGSDLVSRGGERASAIHRVWTRGDEMWNRLNFCVVARTGFELAEKDLPPRSMLVRLDEPSVGSSTEIRENIFKRLPYSESVPTDVGVYIERYGLYRGRIPARRTSWRLSEPRLRIVADMRNPRAAQLAEHYRKWEDPDAPNCILVLGGDGTMLNAIRQNWRRRLPFLGVNRGHLGFLLNEPESLPVESLDSMDLVVRQMPMLFVESTAPDGLRRSELAFNDAWIERRSSQSAWLEVTVNGQVRIPKLVADGALVCTAAGSTAYARSMGVAPLLADMPGWLVVGSNVMTPTGWKSALLSPESVITLRSLGGEKRMLGGFVDGRDLGDTVSFMARQSRIAPVEIAFAARHDMAEKISRIQFPANEGGLLG
jgi:NAD kinase